jgi:hypothetical protein
VTQNPEEGATVIRGSVIYAEFQRES